MSTQSLEQQTYLPEQADEVAEVLSFMDAHESVRGAMPSPRFLLVGADEGDSVEIPESIHRVLRQVVEAMKAGKAVTVAPQNKLITTQQAADLLGVSRPTVVKLINTGSLPAQTPGKRRRMIKLDDLMAYRARRREQQYRALIETSVDYDEPEDAPDVVAEQLRRIRAEVAEERRRTQT